MHTIIPTPAEIAACTGHATDCPNEYLGGDFCCAVTEAAAGVTTVYTVYYCPRSECFRVATDYGTGADAPHASTVREAVAIANSLARANGGTVEVDQGF